jgi:predicted transglutaminase-like cysteine proteinase
MFRAVLFAIFLAVSGQGFAAARVPAPAYLVTGERMSPPLGFAALCRNTPDACGVAVTGAGADQTVPAQAHSPLSQGSDAGRIGRASAYPAASLQQSGQIAFLKRINRYVNQRVVQLSDIRTTGEADRWRLSGVGPGAVGDCEDIALEKQHELVRQGFPPDRLALAVAYSRAAGLHAVLIARTKDGDVVLDSRNPRLMPWNEAPYQWISIQSMGDPLAWYRVLA